MNFITHFVNFRKSKKAVKHYLESDEIRRELIENPVVDEKGLQKRWDNPTIISLDKHRKALISTYLTTDNGVLKWQAAGRVILVRTGNVKYRKVWMKYDVVSVKEYLIDALKSVGGLDKDEWFDSKWALHYQKPLTEIETRIVVNMAKVDKDYPIKL